MGGEERQSEGKRRGERGRLIIAACASTGLGSWGCERDKKRKFGGGQGPRKRGGHLRKSKLPNPPRTHRKKK